VESVTLYVLCNARSSYVGVAAEATPPRMRTMLAVRSIVFVFVVLFIDLSSRTWFKVGEKGLSSSVLRPSGETSHS
jgi:hypothetical protein